MITINNENLCLIDWLSFTSKIDSVESIINFLALQDCRFVETKGMYGYRDRLHYEGINIHYNCGREDMPNVWLEMSGSGCRTYETYGNGDWVNLLDNISSSDDYNITRLDVAYDDHIGILDMSRLVKDTLNENYISKWNSWEVMQSSKGATIYFGSPKSDIRLRIYDKARERGLEDIHWIRSELQLRDEMATAFCRLGLDEIGLKFCGVLTRYIRYVQPNRNDSNKSRWKNIKYWDKLIDNASAIRLYSEVGVEYNLSRVKGYVYEQAGNSIATLLEIEGIETVLKELKERKSTLSKKQLNLIDEHRAR